MAGEVTEPGAGQVAHWPYAAHPPQRYTGNRHRYLAQGGLVRFEEDVGGFVAGGRNLEDMARYYFFCSVLDQLAKEAVPGDIAELGVYKGDTGTLMAGIARKLGRTAYLLDTFEGFSAADLSGVDLGIRMEFQDTSLEAVRALVGEERVEYVRGYFPESAATLPADAIYCLVHIDCDLYAPMKSALDYFYPRMAPGGYIVLHDYGSLHWSGAERAVDEFFADKPESPITLPDGAGSAVVRRAKSGGIRDNWLAKRRAAAMDGGWIDGSSQAFTDLLLAGWSGIEAWGVWGIGAAHSVAVTLPPGHSGAVVLEVEALAALIGDRIEQVVEVTQDGLTVATWTFTLACNQAVRSLELAFAMPDRAGTPQRIEFRPRSVARCIDLDPAANDDRELGLGVARIRISTRT